MKIDEIDKNFSVAKIGDEEFEFYDVLKAPFVLEGLPFGNREGDGAPYFRVPKATMDSLSKERGEVEAVMSLSRCTSGASVRFRAKATKIAIRYKTRESYDMNHMPRCGSAGFDLFRIVPGDTQYRFLGCVQPQNKGGDSVFSAKGEEIIAIGNGEPLDEECEYMLNLPLYGGVEKLELGFKAEATILPPRPHRVKPICFYGSSITQGGCASRPGNNYCSMLCRAVDAEQINLGFSGNAWGSKAMAELINELDLSCFVMDYDHNAPSLEHLEKTHERFFKIVREAHPELPIIMLSKCDVDHRGDDLHNRQRREIVQRTYLNALAAGDRRVWFVDGRTLLGTEDRDACAVDGCHPNDLGFYRMFKTVLPVLQEALKL